MINEARIAEGRAILDDAVATYDPSHVFALFSGGNDSLTETHLTMQHPRASGVVHINTGIGLPETRAFVYETCKQYGWPLKEYAAAESYEQWVLTGGFPGPAQHSIMYNRLKGRSVDALVRDHKQEWHGRSKRGDRIMLVTGARRQESQRRMGTVERMRRVYAQVWVNPLYAWTKADVWDYKAHFNLPTNPATTTLGMSGECLCGAFAEQHELEQIAHFFPQMGAYLHDLQDRVAAAGYPWGWDEAPPAWFHLEKRGQGRLFDFNPLCSSCLWQQSVKEAV